MTIETEVPAEQPVEIDLSKEDKEQKQEPEKVEAQPKPEPEVQEQDDGSEDLRRQMQAAQAAVEAANKRAAREQQLRLQAQQQAYNSRQEGAQAQYDAILNAIDAAQKESDSASLALEAAVEAQDAKSMAEAQRRIARAETQLTQLEDGKNAFEMRQEQYRQQIAAQQAQRQQPQRQLTVHEAIDQNPNFLPEERAWLKQHPEVLTNAPKNAKVTAAFFEAQEKGIQRGSREYFQHMDKAMGYTKRQPVVAAPPSREPVTHGGEVISGSRITLSPAQRQAAKDSNISEVEYARQLIKMREAQKSGLIQ
jgi:hypothetical protein